MQGTKTKRSSLVPLGVVAAGIATVALIWPNGDPDGGNGIRSGVGKDNPHKIEVIVKTDAGRVIVAGDAVSNVRGKIYGDGPLELTTKNGELPYRARFNVFDDESVTIRVSGTIRPVGSPATVECEIRVDEKVPNVGRPRARQVADADEEDTVSCYHNWVGGLLR